MASSFLLIAYKITILQLGEPGRRRLHVAPHSPLDPTEAVIPGSPIPVLGIARFAGI